MAGSFIKMTVAGGFVQGAVWIGIFSVTSIGLQTALTINHSKCACWVESVDASAARRGGGVACACARR
jgi:hypothetical protein